MSDEAAIIEIMRAIGIYDFVMDRVKDQTQAVRMFQNDFVGLIELCLP